MGLLDEVFADIAPPTASSSLLDEVFAPRPGSMGALGITAAEAPAIAASPPEPQYPEWLRKFEAAKRGLNKSPEGLFSTVLGGGKQTLKETGLQTTPTTTERAIEGVASLASPVSLLTFIVGGGVAGSEAGMMGREQA